MIGYKKISALSAIAITLFINSGQLNAQVSLNELAGKWRGEFTIRDGVKAPFNFEIGNNGMVTMINADERFETGAVQLKNDSVIIPLDQFDNELAFLHTPGKLTGVLRKQDHAGSPTKVMAEKGKIARFENNTEEPARDISGRYEVEFELESGRKEKAVAVFTQEGKKLTGTFLKPSGDTRFLEGTVTGNRFYLSSFIGSSPGYYEGTVTDAGKITGVQVGTRIKNKFSGKYNQNAALANPYQVSDLKKGYSTIDFSFPDINGNKVSLKDEKYKNKVVIVAITGTWCPNCVDEAGFLSPWYQKNRDRGVEIITIHYERQSDTGFVRKVMSRFRKRFDIQYDQVFGGIANNDSVSRSLPALKSFKSFPTTIFIGKDGKVSRIHTGYTGPATGRFYEEFVKDFNDEVDRLLSQ